MLVIQILTWQIDVNLSVNIILMGSFTFVMVVLGLALSLPPDPGELYVGDGEPGDRLHARRDHGGQDGAHQRRHEGRQHHHRGRDRAREEVQRPGEWRIVTLSASCR